MDDEKVIQMRRIIVRLARQFNASSTGEGLTPSQSSVLGLIVSRGPLSLAELGSLEGLNPTMLSRVIGRLHTMSLITRSQDPADLRTVSINATATGVTIFRRIQERQTAVVSQCLELLDGSQEAVLLEALPVLEQLTGILQRVA